MVNQRKILILIIATFIPGIILPFITMYNIFGVYTPWIFMVLWIIYVYVILLLSYMVDKGEGNV